MENFLTYVPSWYGQSFSLFHCQLAIKSHFFCYLFTTNTTADQPSTMNSIMMKPTVIYLLLLLSGLLQACNPPAPNTTSSQLLTTPFPPITSTASPLPSLPASNDKVTMPLLEEYVPNCHNDTNHNSTTHAYQHITVSGLPFQRGESHGSQAKDKILKVIAFYKTSKFMPVWSDCINFVRTNYLQALQHYYPNGLEEMKGIAAGAGVQLEDILILNAKDELIRWLRGKYLHTSASNPYPERKAKPSSELYECIMKDNPLNSSATAKLLTTVSKEDNEDNIIYDDEETDECTGGVALSSSTKYAHVLLGQNWDTNEFVLEKDTAILLEVHPDPCENIKPFVVLTEAGQLGSSGMNSDGHGVVAMSLRSSGDTFQKSSERGWIPSSLLRRMFLESVNFSAGLRAILRAPTHVSVNMIVATSDDEALNIELTPNRHFTSQVPLEKEFLAHSNHFKSTSFNSRNDINEDSQGGTSLFRDRRVERHLMNAWPRITEETFQTALKDHVGYPNSVCAHAVPKKSSWASDFPGKTTVASIIFNLSQRTLQLATGPPCASEYKNYCFNFSQL